MYTSAQRPNGAMASSSHRSSERSGRRQEDKRRNSHSGGICVFNVSIKATNNSISISYHPIPDPIYLLPGSFCHHIQAKQPRVPQRFVVSHTYTTPSFRRWIDGCKEDILTTLGCALTSLCETLCHSSHTHWTDRIAE